MSTQYITDEKGRKKAVILPIKEYEKILEDLDELEDIRLYDEAMKYESKSVPAEEAFRQLDAKRKKR